MSLFDVLLNFVDTMARSETLDLCFESDLEDVPMSGDELAAVAEGDSAAAKETRRKGKKPLGLQVW